MNTNRIDICFDGPGRYWLTDGQGSIDLGDCATEAELIAAVQTAVDVGSGDENWLGWSATK